jgi:hypothetical protein
VDDSKAKPLDPRLRGDDDLFYGLLTHPQPIGDEYKAEEPEKHHVQFLKSGENAAIALQTAK